MKKLISFAVIVLLLFCACDDTTSETDAHNDSVGVQDSTQFSSESLEPVSPLIGRWELVEKRIPDIGAIPLGNIFFTFDRDGNVKSEHNDDSGIEQESTPYTMDEETLYFNETQYEILSLQGDTLYLKNNTDGIVETSLLVKQ